MPTYDYLCGACGHRFDKFESIKAKPSTVCPKCGKPDLARLISGGGAIIFKGDGFYCTRKKSIPQRQSER
jgi:putative FmdB family regulatory protein